MIQFAGVELSSATPEMHEHLERWWRPEYAEYYMPSGSSFQYASRLPWPRKAQDGPPKLGTLHWPSGASRWATFFQLISGEQLARMRDNGADIAAGLHPGSIGFTLDISDGDETDTTSTKISPSMLMLPPRPVTTSGVADESVWLLCLVDERWFWWLSYTILLNEAYHDQFTDWTTLIGNLLTAVDLTSSTYTIDTIPDSYQFPSLDRWASKSVPAPLMLDAACEAVGARLSRAIDGTVRIWRCAAAATVQSTEWTTNQSRLVYGGVLRGKDLAAVLPSRLDVLFDSLDDTPVVVSRYYADAISVIDSSLIDENNRQDVFGQVYAEIGADEFGSVQDDYAIQVGLDWYGWRLAGRVDATFSGIVNWTISPAEMAIEWSDGNGDKGDICTTVKAWPCGDWSTYGSVTIPRGEIVRWIKIEGAESLDGTYWKCWVCKPNPTIYAYEARARLAKGAVFTDGVAYLATLNGTFQEFSSGGIPTTYELYWAGGEDQNYINDCVDGVDYRRKWTLPSPWTIGPLEVIP